MKTRSELARIAYEAFAQAQVNRAGRGKAIHPWECLKAAEQHSWETAVEAVYLAVSSDLDADLTLPTGAA